MIGDLYQSALRYGGTYEESSADGELRPHWAPLMDSLRSLGTEELGRRWALAERRIRENGITYNIYGDPEGVNRPWRTDVVPLLISEEEWSFIEAGIIQRADLLSRLLEDLYGPQTLLKEGRFPAALLYGNPAFLRPLVGVAGPQTELPAYARCRSRAVTGRPVVGACGPHAGTLRQRLCAGKSDDRLGPLTGALSRRRMCRGWRHFSGRSGMR